MTRSFPRHGFTSLLPRALAIAVLVLTLGARAEAQPFAEAATLPGAWWGATAWADIDGDGDLDLTVIGTNNTGEVYRNDGFGGLTRDVAASNELSNLSDSAAAWGDYDGDGDPDLVICGFSFSGSPVTHFYRNNGTGGFTFDAAASTVVRGTSHGDLAWVDLDGDGDLDLTVIGTNNTGEVYRNNGTGTLTLDAAVSAVLPNLFRSALDWGDMDGDGDLDLAILGMNTSNVATGSVYRNDGTGALTLDAAASAVLVDNSGVWPALAWVDVDGDGDLDLAAAVGDGPSGRVSELYRNDGTGVLTRDDAASTTIGDFFEPRMAWGDPDGDGDPDLLITGYPTTGGRFTHFYRNDGTGAFTRDTSIDSVLPGLGAASMNWVDVDGDGDLDLEMHGYADGAYGRLFRNGRIAVVVSGGPVDGSGNPIPEPVFINAAGGTVRFAADIQNAGTEALATRVWLAVRFPDGTLVTKRNAKLVEIAAGDTRPFNGSFDLFPAFPAGTYTLYGYYGTHPDSGTEVFAITIDKVSTDPLKAGSTPSLTPAEIAALDPDAFLSFGDEAQSTMPGAEMPTSTALGSAYPNPFNPSATVPFTLAEAAAVRLAVYDVLGREVAVLVDGRVEAGSHTVRFEAQDLPSGTYLVRFAANGHAQTQRLTLVK